MRVEQLMHAHRSAIKSIADALRDYLLESDPLLESRKAEIDKMMESISESYHAIEVIERSMKIVEKN